MLKGYVESRIAKIGHLQVEVLGLIARKTPAFAEAWLADYRQGFGMRLSAVEEREAAEGVGLLDAQWRELWAERERFKRGRKAHPGWRNYQHLSLVQNASASAARTAALRGERPDVPWSLEAHLGRSPSRSESARYSYALRKLEERGLVTRFRGKSGRGDTYKVRLTPSGVMAAVQLSRLPKVEAMKAEGVVFEESDS